MPRGLGDSPLKRRDKTRKQGSARQVAYQSRAREDAEQEQPGDHRPGSDSASGGVASAGSSRSYNSIFFERRTETAASFLSPAVEVSDNLSISGEAAAESLPQAIAAAVVTTPAETASPSISETSLEQATSPVTGTSTLGQDHEVRPEPGVSAQPPPPSNVQEPIQKASATQAPQVQKKSGFLGRLLSMLKGT